MSNLLFSNLLFSRSPSARSDDDARVVAAYTTRTAIVLTTLTTTVPFTCANQFGTNVCQKRRYRRMVHIDKNLDAADDIE